MCPCLGRRIAGVGLGVSTSNASAATPNCTPDARPAMISGSCTGPASSSIAAGVDGALEINLVAGAICNETWPVHLTNCHSASVRQQETRNCSATM
jgi:hypothetical protein